MSTDAREPSASPAVLLAGLALLVSLGHLAYDLAASPKEVAVTDEQTAPEAPAAGARVGDCRCDDGPVRREVAELRDVVALLRARVDRAGGSVGTVAAGSATPGAAAASFRPEPSERELEMSLPGDEPLPEISMFMDVPTGVRLSQRDDMTLEVVAVDPEVSGRQYVVYVLTAKGETKVVRFTVP